MIREFPVYFSGTVKNKLHDILLYWLPIFNKSDAYLVIFVESPGLIDAVYWAMMLSSEHNYNNISAVFSFYPEKQHYIENLILSLRNKLPVR